SGYSQWGFTCYPTGEHSGSRGSSAEKVLAASRQPPRHGGATGFLSTPLAAPATGADIANSANRPFLGIPKPRNSAGGFAFDMGADAAHQFRAYTWGQDGEAWPRTGGWVVRVADRFAVEGLWSNAPTRVPWPSILHAAHLFGADRANRYASSWQLSLDPSERAGVLRITTTGTTELHFIEQDKATLSVGNTVIGPI